jgi:hypothetical protein
LVALTWARTRQQRPDGFPPRVVAGREPQHQVAVGGEHLLGDAGGEHVRAGVPVEQHATGQLAHLGVQPHLGVLRADPHRVPERSPHGVVVDLAEPDRAGVDDGGEHRFARAAGQLAQDVDAAERAVPDSGVQAGLHLTGLQGEGARLGQVGVEQHRAGEVPDQPVHVVVQVLAVEQRQVEQEPW